MFKNFTANLGIRYDQYSLVTSAHALSPRVNLAYAIPSIHSVVHFAYNRFFAPPPIENLLLSSALGFEGRPPGISSSNHFETGVTHSVKDKLLLRMTAYWRGDINAFETTELANVRIFVPTTFAKGKAYGLELSAQLPEIKPIGLSGYFGFTAQRAFRQVRSLVVSPLKRSHRETSDRRPLIRSIRGSQDSLGENIGLGSG